jgi:threonine dehydrogenase-like Zn-dependent dehydrogenase
VKALVLDDLGHLMLRDIADPIADDDEVIVRVVASGICGSDLQRLRHPDRYRAERRPVVPGHEIAGFVQGRETIGPVVVNPLLPCRRCRLCSVGADNLCASMLRLGSDLAGGWTELVRVPATSIVELGAIPVVDGVLVDPLACVIHGFHRCPAADLAQCCVVGDGTLGFLVAGYLLDHGAEDITVLGKHPLRLDTFAGAFPGCTTLVVGHTGPAERGTLSSSFSLVVDAAGGAEPTPFHWAADLLSPRGTILLLGAYAPGTVAPVDLRALALKECSLMTSVSHSGPGRDFFEARNLLESGAGWVEHLTTAQVPLEAASTLLDNTDLLDRHLKVVFSRA